MCVSRSLTRVARGAAVSVDAGTLVAGDPVLTAASVLARVWLHPRAEGDLLLAVAALEAGDAAALVLADLVDAGPVVLAPVLRTVVHILLAPHPLEPGRTLAAENIS